MVATRALLLVGLAAAVALPMAVLVEDEGHEPIHPHTLPSPCAGASSLRFELEVLSEPAAHATPQSLHLALPDPRDAEIERLREALLAAAEENGRLREELRDQTLDYAERLDRRHLEDDLHEMLRRDFPAVVGAFDPNAEESPEDEVVALLLQVADWLAQQGLEAGTEEALPSRAVHLADVRDVVSDSDILALAGRLPQWNEQLALAPCPQTWWAEDPPRSGSTLMRAWVEDGEVIVVPVVELAHEDPRIQAAHEARYAVLDRRARDLEGVLGLPAGALE